MTGSKDYVEAANWYRKAAEQGLPEAQARLGNCYANGEGVVKDYAVAVRWFRKAAEQGDIHGQFNLHISYAKGDGVAKDYVEAYKWIILAAAQGHSEAKKNTPLLEKWMTAEQIAEGQRLARMFKPRKAIAVDGADSYDGVLASRPFSTGTGFLITDDGFLITNEHVVNEAS